MHDLYVFPISIETFDKKQNSQSKTSVVKSNTSFFSLIFNTFPQLLFSRIHG